MKFRITLLIPVLLLVTTIASSVLVYTSSKWTAEDRIRNDAKASVKLDITRLQNLLYNRLTERESNLIDVRLNLSVTAMDPMIRNLLLTDESNQVVLANHYRLEGESAIKNVDGFDARIAQQVRQTNTPFVEYLHSNNTMLHGYYPVILQLEQEQGSPTKNVGVLFTEVNIAQKLAAAYSDAANQSFAFAGYMSAVALLISWLLHLLVSKRLNKLSNTASRLASGNLDARAQLTGKDELAQLGDVFDHMATQIKHTIHQQQQAEEDLRELNETLEQRVAERAALLQEAQRIGQMGNWIWNVDSGEIYWSDEIYRIFGFQPGDIKPTYENFLSMVLPEDRPLVKNSVEQAFVTKDRYSMDHRIVLHSGEERWVHEEGIPYVNETGEPISMSGTVQDITTRKRDEQKILSAKEEAERASQAKTVFLARMSHELRTPMNAILGFSQVLQSESLTDDQRDYINEILGAGKHLLALINELLDLGRIESGQMTMVLQAVNPRSLVNDAVKLVDPLITDNDLKVDLIFDTDKAVIADRVRLRQVLVNLLSNAAKYNNHGGSIKIQCQSDSNTTRISVSDQGKGIRPEHMKHLFTPFERMDAEYGAIDGTGVGLALSKQLITLMKGEIGADSQINEGSTFWIELPLAQKIPEQKDTDKEVTENIATDRVILYIEDNPSNLHLVEAIFKNHPNLKLISAFNGNTGLEQARKFRPDLILLDINLPDIDGYEVLKQLRKDSNTKDIPVIALSADAMPLDIEFGLKEGLKAYLTKPVDIKELIQAINLG